MIQNLFGHKEGQGQSLNFIISGVKNLIIWQFWWLVELLESFHGCPHNLLTQLKLECKEMVLEKARSSKVPCTVSELQSQVSKEVYIQQWFALASVLCYGLIHEQCWFLSSWKSKLNHWTKLVIIRGISILGEVRNAEIWRVTQLLLCSKF